MEWVITNWLWIVIAIVFIGLHLVGHGGHGGHGGHVAQATNDVNPANDSPRAIGSESRDESRETTPPRTSGHHH